MGTGIAAAARRPCRAWGFAAQSCRLSCSEGFSLTPTEVLGAPGCRTLGDSPCLHRSLCRAVPRVPYGCASLPGSCLPTRHPGPGPQGHRPNRWVPLEKVGAARTHTDACAVEGIRRHPWQKAGNSCRRGGLLTPRDI